MFYIYEVWSALLGLWNYRVWFGIALLLSLTIWVGFRLSQNFPKEWFLRELKGWGDYLRRSVFLSGLAFLVITIGVNFWGWSVIWHMPESLTATLIEYGCKNPN